MGVIWKNTTDVNLQDQTTDPIIVHFNRVHNSTTLTTPAVLHGNTVEVNNATGIVVGSYLILFDPSSVRFTTCFVLGIVSTTITIDCPIDFEYPAGTYVDIATVDLNVDGSSTPQIFGLRGIGSPPGIALIMDVTILIFECTTSSIVSLAKFGNLTSLTNGLFMRSRNNRVKNIFNLKNNGEIAGIMFDFDPYVSTNPAQGQDGFISRLTFAGQNKLGVAIRLPIGDDLEIWVRDNLSGLLKLRVIAEGHIVDY